MDATSAARVKEWLRINRGDETQANLAADITKVTGWHITRDRYSKYEGTLPIGRKVLAHFVHYWTGRGRPGPFDASPEPTTATETPDPLVSALQAQTQAIQALVRELEASRLAQAEESVAMMKAIVVLSGGQVPRGTPGADDPAARAGTPQ